MICTKTVPLQIAINTAAGSMYMSSLAPLGDWADTFYAKPVYTVSQNSGTSLACIYFLTDASTTSAGSIQFLRTTANASANVGVGIIAIGRWKA